VNDAQSNLVRAVIGRRLSWIERNGAAVCESRLRPDRWSPRGRKNPVGAGFPTEARAGGVEDFDRD